MFEDGSRIIFRLSGTGSAGATIRWGFLVPLVLDIELFVGQRCNCSIVHPDMLSKHAGQQVHLLPSM